MPYKDPEKRKEYYHRHQKHYMKKWRKKSNKWNEYQREYKLKRKSKQVEDIKIMISTLNLADDKNSLFFKAAVIYFYIIITGIKKEWAIAYKLNYELKDVKFIISNWTKYNVYNNGIFDFYIDIDGNMIEQMINLSLRCLIGTGEVIRYDPQPTIPQKMGTYEAISTFNNELYKIKAMIYKLTQ